MTQHPMEPAAEPAWSEPPSGSRPAATWNESARYGASLVGTLLGGYLVATSSIGQFVQAAFISTGLGPEYTLLTLTRYLFAFVVLALAVAIAPTSIARRAGATALVVVAGFLLAVLTAMRFLGPLPGGPFWNVALHPVFVAVLVATAAWLLVRERPGLTFLLLIPTVLVGFVPMWMTIADFPAAAVELVTVPLAFVLGVGIAWIAAAIARAMRR